MKLKSKIVTSRPGLPYIKKDSYPSNDNKTLEDCITKVTNDIETMVSDFKDAEWNNLNQNERQALEKLR